MAVIVKTQVICFDCGTKFFVGGVVQSGSLCRCPSCEEDREVQAVIVLRKQIEREAEKL